MIESRHISWQTIWRVIIIAGLLVFAYYIRSVLAILFFSVIIFAAFDPIVDWFEKKKLGRILGTIFVYIAGIVIMGLAIAIVVPVIYREIVEVADLLPGYSEKFLNYIIGSKFAENINQVLLNYSGSFVKSGSAILSTFFNLVGGIVSAISALLISFYLLVRKNGVIHLIRSILPQSLEYPVIRVWQRSRIRVGKWFRTQLLLSLLVGISVYIALALLGVKYALVLGLIAAILEIVPVVGPIFAGVTSALVALSQSVPLAIWVIAIFIIIQQLESNVFVPLMMKKSVGLNPVLVIIAILAGAKLGGILGIIFALPVMVILEEIIEEANRRRSSSLPVK